MRKLLLIALWAWVPFCWQPLCGQAPRVGIQPGSQEKQQPQPAKNDSRADQAGTKDRPFIVDTKGHTNTPKETAAEKAADDQKNFIDTWTFRLTFANTAFTFLLMLAGIGGILLANRTVRAIEREMELSHRPWVKIRPEFITPLALQEGGDLIVTIRFHVENIGTSPAMRTIVEAELDPSWESSQVDINWKLFCDKPQSPLAEKFGFTLFPGDSAYQDIGFRISSSTIDANLSPIAVARLLNLTLMGRAGYDFSFAKGFHKTPFAFDVRRFHPASPDAPFMISLTELSASELVSVPPLKLFPHIALSKDVPVNKEAT